MNELLKEIEKSHEKISIIQDLCSHPYIEYAYKASIGNYDPSVDRHWTEYKCKLCLKRWTKEGSISPEIAGYKGIFKDITYER